jgi:hypothetical protein
MTARGISTVRVPHARSGPANPAIPPRKESTEHLAYITILSAALVATGAVGLSKNNLVLPTRVGVQHLSGGDARVFYAVILVVFVTNAVRLFAWIRYKGGNNGLFRFGDAISKFALVMYVGYCFLSLFQ